MNKPPKAGGLVARNGSRRSRRANWGCALLRLLRECRRREGRGRDQRNKGFANNHCKILAVRTGNSTQGRIQRLGVDLDQNGPPRSIRYPKSQRRNDRAVQQLVVSEISKTAWGKHHSERFTAAISPKSKKWRPRMNRSRLLVVSYRVIWSKNESDFGRFFWRL